MILGQEEAWRTPKQSWPTLAIDLKCPPLSQAKTSQRNLQKKDSEESRSMPSPPSLPNPHLTPWASRSGTARASKNKHLSGW